MLDLDLEWSRAQASRKKADGEAFWDKRAETYESHDSSNEYATRFLELAHIEPGQTVFDMGCGTGMLCEPLASDGCRVIGADFSAKMLELVKERAQRAGIPLAMPTQLLSLSPTASGCISTIKMSWEDEWSAYGITPNCVDTAIASRSIVVEDLRAALLKLSSVARRQACISLTTMESPRVDARILRDLGAPAARTPDATFAFGMLIEEGFEPEVSHIHSERTDTFESREEAFNKIVEMLCSNRTIPSPEEADCWESRINDWLDKHLIANPKQSETDSVAKPLAFDQPRCVSWSFIRWDTN